MIPAFQSQPIIAKTLATVHMKVADSATMKIQMQRSMEVRVMAAPSSRRFRRRQGK
jgi:hypothetical protein